MTRMTRMEDDPLKIVHVITSLTTGGAERQLELLVNRSQHHTATIALVPITGKWILLNLLLLAAYLHTYLQHIDHTVSLAHHGELMMEPIPYYDEEVRESRQDHRADQAAGVRTIPALVRP